MKYTCKQCGQACEARPCHVHINLPGVRGGLGLQYYCPTHGAVGKHGIVKSWESDHERDTMEQLKADILAGKLPLFGKPGRKAREVAPGIYRIR